MPFKYFILVALNNHKSCCIFYCILDRDTQKIHKSRTTFAFYTMEDKLQGDPYDPCLLVFTLLYKSSPWVWEDIWLALTNGKGDKMHMITFTRLQMIAKIVVPIWLASLSLSFSLSLSLFHLLPISLFLSLSLTGFELGSCHVSYNYKEINYANNVRELRGGLFITKASKWEWSPANALIAALWVLKEITQLSLSWTMETVK